MLKHFECTFYVSKVRLKAGSTGTKAMCKIYVFDALRIYLLKKHFLKN